MADTPFEIGLIQSFAEQAVFLTGSTGGMGGCILYKLAVQLPTKKIYVLCRGSKERAIAKWRKSMGNCANAILATKKVVFVLGDIVQPNFGLSEHDLEAMRRDTTVIIHSAASIALNSELAEAIEQNCLPCLELARMATSFPMLKLLVQTSTAYVNTFLSDGKVLEKIYSDIAEQDPEQELQHILNTGDHPNTNQYTWPYAHSKHLMERLLHHRHSNLPILIVRPSIIGPAIRHPFPHYGPPGSNPASTFVRVFLSSDSEPMVFHVPQGQTSGTNILDEVPVDWVANVALLHIAAGSVGIVHAGAQLYVPRTLDALLGAMQDNAGEIARRKQLPKIIFSADHSVEQCFLAELFRICARNWDFDCQRSLRFKELAGPLSLRTDGHDMTKFTDSRVRMIASEVLAASRPAKL
ncbi:uncharacterized protein EURHEDRAFT_374202 [Aspergillus ruber CBS 135680]|uniref:Fatty acyl-CoA reductase n=1 Tax=Aspergillus ruber (strain CBS 135680) TaxID=1388766 RepID=A0A017SRD5_ASPRC|nr:uncharacterized protein EURHEDRAFT_374202 [Aspergillus ruber CBS 135680]EYE99129.1 hypothetical protein EURHEDRAFT_374202 [Aspergillus ruber CBS 135680]